jgi:Protein of unknown function (DUF2569)
MFDEDQTTSVRRIYFLLLLLPICLKSKANGDILSVSLTSINWITVWQSFFFGVLFTMLFKFLNKKTKTVDQRSDAGLPVNGWVFFLGINLAVRIVIQFYFLWTAKYFSQTKWLQLGQAGGSRLQTIFIFELFLSLFSLTGTSALIYWFFGRRDIFPRMFIFYVGFYIVANLILMVIYFNISVPVNMKNLRHDNIIQVFRILYAVAWFAYLLKSEQVKQTFVYPPD